MLDKKDENEYRVIKKIRENISKEIIKLKQDEKVKKYLSLVHEDKNLFVAEREVYETMKYREYKSCHHLGIRTLLKRDYLKGSVNECLGCIKCGLDESIISKVKDSDINNFSFEEQCMYNYLINRNSLNEINLDSNVVCNLDLARAIYSKIIKKHPDIDDMTALKYLEIALKNMQTKDIHESRRQSRVKRLNLNKNFNAF